MVEPKYVASTKQDNTVSRMQECLKLISVIQKWCDSGVYIVS